MSPLNVQCGCFRAGHLACNQLCASQDSIAQELVDDSHALEDQVDPQIEFPDNQLGLPASEEDAAEPPADPVAGEVAAENAAEPPAVPVAGEVAARTRLNLQRSQWQVKAQKRARWLRRH